jgi:hypothetical protein
MIQMRVFLQLKYGLFLCYFNENLVFSMVFQKSPNIKFHENPCGRTDGLIDIMKLIVVFTIFQMCWMMKVWVSALCLCGISNKAYFVTNFCVCIRNK